MDLKTLIAGYAQPGHVEWIGLRPGRKEAMISVDKAEIDMTGLVADHGRPGKRAITLIQAEHLPVIGAMLGQAAIAPDRLRRNLVISGINLAALRGRQLRLGSAVVEVTTVCAPCSRMEAELGKGGYSALRGHGGWCAQVVDSGLVGLGDLVNPVD